MHQSHFSSMSRHARTINYNVTNITNVTQVRVVGGWKGSGHGRKNHRGMYKERPPRLLQYLAEGRSEGELCTESVRTLGYATRGFCLGVEGMAKGVAGVVGGAAGLAVGTIELVAALFGKDITK